MKFFMYGVFAIFVAGLLAWLCAAAAQSYRHHAGKRAARQRIEAAKAYRDSRKVATGRWDHINKRDTR